MAEQRQFNCSNEEAPVIGGFVLDRALLDVDDLRAVATDITTTYLTGLKADRDIIMGLVRPRKKTDELAAITRRLYAGEDELKQKLNIVEIQLDRAKADLLKPVSKFGLVKLYAAIRKRNAEGVISLLGELIGDLNENTAALTAKGFTVAQRDRLVDLKSEIDEANSEQNTKIAERSELTAANVHQINVFWEQITGIMKTGRLLYKDNPEKRKEYTFAVLKKRVNATRRKGEVNVLALDEVTGNPLAGADASLKRKAGTDMIKSVKRSEADGVVPFDPQNVGEYDVEVTADGYVLWTGTVMVVAGEMAVVEARMRKSA
jgi:hypothetical protein